MTTGEHSTSHPQGEIGFMGMVDSPSCVGASFRLYAPSDASAYQSLFESDPAYFVMTQGEPPTPEETHNTVTELPPGKTHDDKFVYGLFDTANRLIGVIDLVRGYPEPDIWFLGLIFLAKHTRGQGLGTRVLDALSTHVRNHGGAKLRLGVVDANPAKALYARVGFEFVYARTREVAGSRQITLSVMERKV